MGGGHKDLLTGGDGGDTFVYETAFDSAVGSTRDVISDFAAGVDRIDLSTIDADAAAASDQSFAFIGATAFSSTAGELRADTSDSLKTIVMGDVNGDGVADFEIELTGSVLLAGTDFFL